MIKSIFFDFDGVILESVDIKSKAFKFLFKNYPQKLKEIVVFHLDNGGISRFEKFRYIYRNILNKKLNKKEEKILGEKFSNYVFNKILKVKFVKGAYLFLRKYYKKIDFFIISGTPQEELRSILEARELNKFFKEIYGSPKDKTKICRLILDKYKYKKEEVLLVGDALSDFKAAQFNKIKFIGRISKDNQELFKNYNIKKIKDFEEFDKIICRI